MVENTIDFPHILFAHLIDGIFFAVVYFPIIDELGPRQRQGKTKLPPYEKMISIREIYTQVAKSATSYYSLMVLPLTNCTLHPLTCCVIGKGQKDWYK